MATFLLVHRHPHDYQGSADTAAAWEAWFNALGDSAVDLGNPVFERRVIGKYGADAPLGGYTLVEADDLDKAVELAQGCPTLAVGGGVEVGELTPHPGRHHPARVF